MDYHACGMLEKQQFTTRADIVVHLCLLKSCLTELFPILSCHKQAAKMKVAKIRVKMNWKIF